MKFLCLAYGDERDWKALTKEQQETLLRQDEVLRDRGALMAAVKTDVVTVTTWEGVPTVTEGAFAQIKVPLAGFSVIEAADVDEVVRLVAKIAPNTSWLISGRIVGCPSLILDDVRVARDPETTNTPVIARTAAR